MAFNDRVDASRSFRFAWMASKTGISCGSDNVSNNGPIAPAATTEDTFSSLPLDINIYKKESLLLVYNKTYLSFF